MLCQQDHENLLNYYITKHINQNVMQENVNIILNFDLDHLHNLKNVSSQLYPPRNTLIGVGVYM